MGEPAARTTYADYLAAEAASELRPAGSGSWFDDAGPRPRRSHANARKLLEVGDIEEALTAAAAIGDVRLQKLSRGSVSPDSFTHGTSAQRVEWFRRGFERGAHIPSATAVDATASLVTAIVNS